MDKKQLEVYGTVCKENNKLIERGVKVKAQCIIFMEGNEQKVYDFELTTKNQEVISSRLKRLVIMKGFSGYIVVLNTKTEKYNCKTKVGVGGDCVIRTLYTPKEMVREYVWYSGNEIIGKDRMLERGIQQDPWDAWNTGSIIVEASAKTKFNNRISRMSKDMQRFVLGDDNEQDESKD